MGKEVITNQQNQPRVDIGDLGKRIPARPIVLVFEAESLKKDRGRPENFFKL